MAKVRVYELAKELGMTNKEALDLAMVLGVPVKSHSSSIQEPQADRIRRRAERDGVVKTIHAKAGATLAVDAPILEFA